MIDFSSTSWMRNVNGKESFIGMLMGQAIYLDYCVSIKK